MDGKTTPTLRVVTDPVCKMELPAATAAATFKFNGRRYYFCHAACLRLFEADPLAYVDDTQPDVIPDWVGPADA